MIRSSRALPMSNIIALLLRPRETWETRSNNIPFTTFSFNRFLRKKSERIWSKIVSKEDVLFKASTCLFICFQLSFGKISDNYDLMIVLVSVPQDSHALRHKWHRSTFTNFVSENISPPPTHPMTSWRRCICQPPLLTTMCVSDCREIGRFLKYKQRHGGYLTFCLKQKEIPTKKFFDGKCDRKCEHEQKAFFGWSQCSHFCLVSSPKI